MKRDDPHYDPPLWIYMLFCACLCMLLFTAFAFADPLPDKTLTPGEARDVDVKTLCTTSTKLARHTTQATKNAVYREYGMSGNDRTDCQEGFEIDHLISLEIAGADVQANLWPQSYCGAWNAHMKDQLENKLHRLVCGGKMPLKAAQDCISTDWVKCYKEIM